MSKNYLLPHCFQYVGWGLFGFSFVFVFLIQWIFNDLRWIDQNYSRLSTMVLYIILFSSAVFVGLSKEKMEDELVRSVRLNSLAITAYVSLIVMFLCAFVYALDHGFRFIHNGMVYIVLKILFNPVTAFMLYIVVFRVSLWKYRKCEKDEE